MLTTNIFNISIKNESNLDPVVMLNSLGKVILEIRKDLGNDKTALKEFDMLRFMITDIDKFNS